MTPAAFITQLLAGWVKEYPEDLYQPVDKVVEKALRRVAIRSRVSCWMIHSEKVVRQVGSHRHFLMSQ